MRTSLLRKDPKKLPLADEYLAQLASLMLGQIAPVFKHPAFTEEAELRLVIDVSEEFLEREDPPVISVRAGQMTLIPYLSIPLSDSDELLQFARVVVGPTPFPELAKRAMLHVFRERRATAREVVNSSIPLRVL
jgi:hypothetical protein